MKSNYSIFTILFFLLAPLLWAGQPPTDNYDMYLYYSQLRNNRSEHNINRLNHLMQTVSFDSLIIEYLKRGHAVAIDSVSVFSYFNDGPVVPPNEVRLQKLDQIYAAASKHKSKRLKVTADYFKAFMMIGFNEEHFNPRMEAYEDVVRQANKAGEPYLEILALREMWHNATISSRYARGFAYGQRYEQALDNAGDDIPWKGRWYIYLARTYYNGDTDRALSMFHKALSLGGSYQLENVIAWNYLAVYHLNRNNLDSAAWYNLTIIASEEALNNRSVHLGIAIANLGRVELGRGNYDTAITMLSAGLEVMRQYKEPVFIVGLYISLGEAWLGKGDTTRAKSYIDSAYVDMNTFDDEHRQERSRNLFRLQSAYYTRLGNHRLATLYIDSMIIAGEKYQEYVGRHNILLGEQQLQEADLELKSLQISKQRNIIVVAIVVLLLITAALLLILNLYRKRNAAYCKLAQKAREWASPGEQPVPTDQAAAAHAGVAGKEPPTKDDLRIMDLAESEMSVNHAYREAGLTAEALADRIGVHRNLLARAISRTTGSNFSTYVNGFRVKEAIRIISTTARRELYIEQLSERVGFGSRVTFTRAFKQFTGISPIVFQKQQENGMNNAQL